jgi:hypothetical protein
VKRQLVVIAVLLATAVSAPKWLPAVSDAIGHHEAKVIEKHVTTPASPTPSPHH